MNTYRFEVSNLNCGGCAGRAERALAGVTGVAAASVNLASKMATVETQTPLGPLQNALSSAGYPAAETRISLAIEGMSCASCASRVEAAVQGIEGVVAAHVNLTTNTAEVTAVKGVVSTQALADAVTQAGYPTRALAQDEDSEARQAKEISALKRDLASAAALTLPVFLGVMGGHLYPPLHHGLMGVFGKTGWWLVQFILTTAVLIGPGRRFYRIGLPLLFKGAPDMNSLVAMGTLAAWGYSSVALFFPSFLPETAREVYFEAAGVIVTLILMGRFLEARAKGRTGAAIRRLVALRPDTAQVERDSEIADLPVSEIVKGDLIHLRAGDRIAVDGIVTKGQSYVDESMITGEPLPVDKSPEDQLIAGTVNGQGALVMQAQAVGADTMLARIISLVEQAQGAKLPIQALADQVVRWFVPAVIALAVLTLLIWLIFGPELTFALVAAVSVLIIACPCAMGLATPVSIMVGTGRGAELGVLFRKGDALQRFEDTRVVAFDKTGTLTKGKPELVDVKLADGFDRDAVLQLAASAEKGSAHPIAQAIAAHAQDVPAPQSVTDIAGFGVSAQIGGQQVLAGAARLMARENIKLGTLAHEVDVMASKGQTPVLIAIDGQIAAALAIADELKPDALETVRALRARGLQVAMITGDTQATAQHHAKALGIDIVKAEVLPEGKLDVVQDLQTRVGPVAFVGDGINDAPALAQADIGIAMGTGTDVAIEAGDVILSSGKVQNVVTALRLSRTVMRNIRQNLFWAFGYNVALIPVAAGLLFPFTGLLLSPMLAAGAMALSSVFVLSNALRLRRFEGGTK